MSVRESVWVESWPLKRDEKFPLPGMKLQFLTGVSYTMR